MKAHISPAIIMRIREFGESDLLVTFLTPDRGRLKGVAKGARRSRKRFVNCLDIFSLVNLEYGPNRKGELYLVHSGRLIEAYPGLRRDFSILSSASYMVELTEILFPWELPDQNIFELLKKSLYRLANGERADVIAVIFETMAMSLGGYSINLEKCCVCGRIYMGEGTAVFRPEKGGIACMSCQQITAMNPGVSPDTVKTIGLMQSRSVETIEQMIASEEIISELRPVLRLHLEYRLGRKPRTSNFLE